MKTNYTKLILLAFSIILMYGCYDEKDILSSGYQVVKRFDFPQGDTEADQIFKEIYDEHGIMIIYKDFDGDDLDRSWTSPAGVGTNGSLYYSYFTGQDTLLQIANYYKNQVFGVVNPDISKRMFVYSPEYLYVARETFDVQEFFLTMGIYYQQDFPFFRVFKGMDSWVTGFRSELYFNEPWLAPEGTIEWQGEEYMILMFDPDQFSNEAAYKANLELIARWFELAMSFDYIQVPEGFQNEVDVTTTLSQVITSEDYCTRRGFAETARLTQFYNSDLFNYTQLSRVRTPDDDFINFIRDALVRADRYEEVFAGDEYALLRKRYKWVLDHLKNENDIDLVQIAQKMHSFYPNVVIE